MSHSVKITLIADEFIRLFGQEVNIHYIDSISVDSHGNIVAYSSPTAQEPVNQADREPQK